MTKVIILLLALIALKTQEIYKTTDTLLLPNIFNSFEPFQFELKNSDELKGNMIIICTPVVQKHGIYYMSNNICGFQFNNKKVSELNALLRNLTINVPQSTNITDQFNVQYKFEILLNNTESPLRGKVDQQFKVADEIPVKQLKQEILFDNKTEPQFYIKFAEFEENYMKNSDSRNFVINYTSNNLPDWMIIEFNDNGIYLKGLVPEDYLEDIAFEFYITDSQTLLASKLIELKTFFNSAFSNTIKPKIIVFFIFMVFCIFILFYFLFKVTKNDSKDKIENKQTQNDDVNTSIILTNSILNWNKEWRDEMEYFKSTQDMTNIDMRSNDSFDLEDKGNRVNSYPHRVDDESLMNEIELFSTIIKRDMTDIERDPQSLFIDDETILNQNK